MVDEFHEDVPVFLTVTSNCLVELLGTRLFFWGDIITVTTATKTTTIIIIVKQC